MPRCGGFAGRRNVRWGHTLPTHGEPVKFQIHLYRCSINVNVDHNRCDLEQCPLKAFFPPAFPGHTSPTFDPDRWVTGGPGFPLVVSRGEMPRTISRIRDERRPWSVRCGQNTDPPSRWPAP